MPDSGVPIFRYYLVTKAMAIMENVGFLGGKKLNLYIQR